MDWTTDLLGKPYEATTFDLGPDPDGEPDVVATLVRRVRSPRAKAPIGAVLYVHGFTDYFFQTHVADYWNRRGYAFYALDLRKCGRSRRPGHTPHFVSDLALHFVELDRALAVVRAETDGVPVVVSGHSTGGLILPLWLDALGRRPGGVRGTGIVGEVLNSPWFDLQGKPWMRTVGTQVLRPLARVRPYRQFELPPGGAYGRSLHVDHHGEWSYDVQLKPIAGCPVTYGWLNAVRRGHARLHRGLDVQVPSLVLRSDTSWITRSYRAEVDSADAVLDVRQIARWAGCLGDAVTAIPITGARHDVFLSREGPRAEAFAELTRWLGRYEPWTGTGR